MGNPFDASGLGGDGVPFIFVPHGDPEPVEWMARHPGWVKFPATFVPHPPAATRPKPMPTVPAAVAGSAATAVGPDISMDALRLATGSVEDVLAGAAASLAAVGILLYPNSTASPAQDEDSPLLPHRRKPVPEALVPPTPTPAPPGLLPPSVDSTKPGEGGFSPTPPAPPLPGFAPMPHQTTILPGHAAEAVGSPILDRDRNDGLEGEARSHSKRARDAARAADPAVISTLPDADWRAHHLINLAGLRAFPDLIHAATLAGWRTDDASNVAPLLATAKAREMLKVAGIDRPVHDSGHPNWNEEVYYKLRRIQSELLRKGLTPASDAYAPQAKEELEELQDQLRQEMLGRRRLTQGSMPSAPVSA